MVGQELHFIVQVVEKHTGAQLISRDRSEGEYMFFIVLFEEYLLVGEIDLHSDQVILFEVK